MHGDYGIGSFGKEAREFADLLCEGGFSLWQTLPLCMTDECNSPYKSYSSFGANPYLIDLPALYEKGLLTEKELADARQKTPYLCEYKRLSEDRLDLLSAAAKRARKDTALEKETVDFAKSHAELDCAAEFLALKEANGGAAWQEWRISVPCEEALFKWRFIQREFFVQWEELKKYANGRGISIIGDVPIYVASDSADVWGNRRQFLLDGKGYPTSVAGVPPDYFAKDGQLWGNPIYDYAEMKRDGYAWWRRRLEYALTLFDGVRLDHFRGFEAFWSVPAGAASAREGKWVAGPRRKLIDAIRDVCGEALVIAEDLGDITPKVDALRSYSGFPGMRVLQFAFLGDENTPHLPYRYEKNTVAYTGTHDNNTLLGYIWELDGETRQRVFDYFGYGGSDFNEACEVIMRELLACPADTVIFPLQDLLVYGSDTRLNTPGKAEGNWAYRVTREQLGNIDVKRYAYFNRLYGRS